MGEKNSNSRHLTQAESIQKEKQRMRITGLNQTVICLSTIHTLQNLRIL